MNKAFEKLKKKKYVAAFVKVWFLETKASENFEKI